MSAPRIHRVTGDSKRGRQLRARTGRIVRGPGLTPEQIAWNARIEAERQARREKHCPCGTVWDRTMYAYDGPHCSKDDGKRFLSK